MRRVIKFDTGEVAVVYKNSDIRTRLTMKQAQDLICTKDIIPVPETKEQLWVQLDTRHNLRFVGPEAK